MFFNVHIFELVLKKSNESASASWLSLQNINIFFRVLHIITNVFCIFLKFERDRESFVQCPNPIH